MMVYLLRHGATRGNRQKRYVGSTDEPLTMKAREALASLHFPSVSRVYVSPKLRCLGDCHDPLPRRKGGVGQRLS